MERRGPGFAAERELAERALAAREADDGQDPVFPPAARRFLEARQAARLTQEEVALRWGPPTSMYWDLEFHDDEAFTVIGLRDLAVLDDILGTPLMRLLFGDEPAPPLPPVSYADVVRRLGARMQEEAISADDLSELAGWELAEYFDAPEKLAELPICGLRSVCLAAGVDWAAVLATCAVRR